MTSTIAISLALAAVLLIGGAAEARLFVLKSDVVAYPVRSVIEADQKLVVPPGKRLTVLLPDGSLRDLTSAHNGPVQAVLKASKPTSWWDDLVKMVMSGGGVDKPGSVRSVSAPPVSIAIEGVRGGTAQVCIERGSVPMITRDRTAARQVVELFAGTADKPVMAEFAAGERSLKWPSELAVLDGQFYRVVPANGTTMVAKVVVIAQGSTGTDAVQALADAGCLPQAAAMLNSLLPK